MSMKTHVDPAAEVQPGPDRGRSAGKARWAALLIVLVLGFAALGWLWSRSEVPADDGPDAGFARAMQVHHAQAVEMAFMIRDRTNDPTLRTIALDIITSQQQQIGQMYGWLEMWRLPQTSTAPLMAWMSTDATHQSSMGSMDDAGMDDAMPGMASDTQLLSLEQARGQRAETLFLRMMIAHHRGGVEMAQRALAEAKEPVVLRLAAAIETAQTAEIEQMQQLLRDRSASGSS